MTRFKGLTDVSADLLKKLSINVEYQSMDWAMVTQRRAKQEPVGQGGWSMFHTANNGADQFDPGVHAFLSGAGAKGVVGWTTSARIEDLRNEWFAAADLAAQKKAAQEPAADARQTFARL